MKIEPKSKFARAADNILLWLVVPLLTTAIQIGEKSIALAQTNESVGANWLLQIFQNPWAILVLVSEITVFLLWLRILSGTNLSKAAPVTAVCYVFIILAGWLLFAERPTLAQFAGVAVILAGLFLIHDTGKPQKAHLTGRESVEVQ